MCGMARDPSMTDDEQPVLLLHPHWKTLIRPILIAVVVVAIALVAEVLIPGGSGAVAARGAVGAVAVLALMVWLTVPVLRWRTTTYELTTKRLRTRYGIVTRRGRDIPLSRINDVSFERGCSTGCSAPGGWWWSRRASTARSCSATSRTWSTCRPRCSGWSRTNSGGSNATSATNRSLDT